MILVDEMSIISLNSTELLNNYYTHLCRIIGLHTEESARN